MNNNGKSNSEIKYKSLFVPTYHVELLYDREPEFNAEGILSDMEESIGSCRIELHNEEHLVFTFEKFTDSEVLPQCVIVKKNNSIDKAFLNVAIQQTWDWPEKDSILKKCKHRIIFSDYHADKLDSLTRLNLFNESLCAFLKNSNAAGVFWVNSLKVVSPEAFVNALNNKEVNEAQDYLYGALNVRLFPIEQRGSEFLMDTMGLGAFGLPDLQVQFNKLSPEEVASVLINYGYYIFEKGDIIGDGHTVQGIDDSQKWLCKHEASKAQPERRVINMIPDKG